MGIGIQTDTHKDRKTDTDKKMLLLLIYIIILLNFDYIILGDFNTRNIKPFFLNGENKNHRETFY